MLGQPRGAQQHVQRAQHVRRVHLVVVGVGGRVACLQRAQQPAAPVIMQQSSGPAGGAKATANACVLGPPPLASEQARSRTAEGSTLNTSSPWVQPNMVREQLLTAQAGPGAHGSARSAPRAAAGRSPWRSARGRRWLHPAPTCRTEGRRTATAAAPPADGAQGVNTPGVRSLHTSHNDGRRTATAAAPPVEHSGVPVLCLCMDVGCAATIAFGGFQASRRQKNKQSQEVTGTTDTVHTEGG